MHPRTTCSAYEIFDVIGELRQVQRNGAESSTVSGATTLAGFDCFAGTSTFTVAIPPQGGTFVSGSATVTVRIATYAPWVIPTEVTRHVRVNAS